MDEMDELDKAIVACLRSHGEMRLTTLAAAVPAPMMAVNARLLLLLAKGAVTCVTVDGLDYWRSI